jgi:hypothetical protein
MGVRGVLFIFQKYPLEGARLMHSTHPGSKPSPSRVRAAIRLAVVALVSLVGAGFGASACLNRPLCDKDCQPKTTNIFVDAIVQKSVDKIDLLFMIDNSISMADKQIVLRDAVPDLVQRLVSPNCIDPNTGTANKAMTPADPKGDCPGDLIREFTPIRNIHVGIVTSSIGGHGSQTLCPGNDAGTLKEQEENDHAWLIGKRPRYMQPAGGVAADAQGFLNWNPDVMMGETPAGFTTTFQAMTTFAGEFGCGLESQLESIYRFLVDPNPYNTIVIQNCPGSSEPCAVPQGRDDNLLAQRKAFLRPDSLVAIIMMTDENDCSIQESGQYYYAARDNIILPHGSSVCTTNPNDKCCYFCNSQPPAGCEDPMCSVPTARTQDQPNLRCFHQKQRFGFDFLYPTQRYVNALTQAQICTSRADLAADPINCRDLDGDKNPDIFDNPLFVGVNGTTAVPRDQSLIFFAGIVGVPYQDLKTDTKPDGTPYMNAANELHYRTAQQLIDDNVWSVILGDDHPAPDGSPPVAPSDSLMIESKDPRGGVDGENPPVPLAATGAARRANPVNGHEWVNTDQDDLQYACIFDLAEPRDCQALATQMPTPGCDCKPGHEADNNPLCQAANGQYGVIQSAAKAYPGLRELKVLKDFGNNSIVASICARNLKDKNAQDYGYRPAVDAIVDRLKEALTGKCLPRTLTPDPKTNEIPCSIIEVRPIPMGGQPNCDAVPGRETPPPGVVDPVRARLRQIGFCGVPNKPSCEAGQSLYFCKIKESNGPTSNCNQNEAPNDVGWCYVDPTAPHHENDDPSLVAKCPATQQRIIRFVDPMNDTPAHDATVLIACFGSTLPAE